MARIHYLDDDNQPQVIDINQDSPDVLVGRSSECQIRTAGHSVSRKHARIGWQDGLYVLEDLGSSNGTFYFTDRLDPHVPVILEDGVICRCGAFELRFEREGLDATLEQPVVHPEEGLPPPPFTIPPPPFEIPPPPFEIPPPPLNIPPPPGFAPSELTPSIPPPPGQHADSAIVNAPTDGFTVTRHEEAEIAVRFTPSKVIPPEPNIAAEAAEPDFDVTQGLEAHAAAPEAATSQAREFGDEIEFSDDDEAALDAVWDSLGDDEEAEDGFDSEQEQESEPFAHLDDDADAEAPLAAAADDELRAAREEVEARTALWRQALADLSESHDDLAAALTRIDALEAERDHLQTAFADADSARRQLAARLELLDGQHEAAEQALLVELAAARAGRPGPAADAEVVKLREDLAAAQAALRGLDDQAEAEAVELRRQLTDALAENDRISAQLDAALLPTLPLNPDHRRDD